MTFKHENSALGQNGMTLPNMYRSYKWLGHHGQGSYCLAQELYYLAPMVKGYTIIVTFSVSFGQKFCYKASISESGCFTLHNSLNEKMLCCSMLRIFKILQFLCFMILFCLKW